MCVDKLCNLFLSDFKLKFILTTNSNYCYSFCSYKLNTVFNGKKYLTEFSALRNCLFFCNIKTPNSSNLMIWPVTTYFSLRSTKTIKILGGTTFLEHFEYSPTGRRAFEIFALNYYYSDLSITILYCKIYYFVIKGTDRPCTYTKSEL